MRMDCALRCLFVRLHRRPVPEGWVQSYVASRMSPRPCERLWCAHSCFGALMKLPISAVSQQLQARLLLDLMSETVSVTGCGIKAETMLQEVRRDSVAMAYISRRLEASLQPSIDLGLSHETHNSLQGNRFVISFELGMDPGVASHSLCGWNCGREPRRHRGPAHARREHRPQAGPGEAGGRR